MGLAIVVILFCVFVGVIFGMFKNGEKGAEEYGKAGFGCSWMILQLFQLISQIIAINFFFVRLQ